LQSRFPAFESKFFVAHVSEVVTSAPKRQREIPQTTHNFER
jgi:hypothetical protein